MLRTDDNRAHAFPPGGSVTVTLSDEPTVTVFSFVTDWPEVAVKLMEAVADPPKALMPTSTSTPAVNDVLLENVDEAVFAIDVLMTDENVASTVPAVLSNTTSFKMVGFEDLETIELSTGVIINVVSQGSSLQGYLLKRSPQGVGDTRYTSFGVLPVPRCLAIAFLTTSSLNFSSSRSSFVMG